MKKAKKYASFEELKSSEMKTSDYRLAFEKHEELERVMKEMMSVKAKKKSLKNGER